MAEGTLSGWVVDLIKAFNLIPRMPTMEFLSRLNVAPAILKAWMNALTCLERRFKIQNCVGPSLRSSTGFPEGCALSVCAMLAHNLVAHMYLRLRHPAVTLWSYVDNIEATAPDAGRALAALENFHNFSDAMDIAVDHDKSYCWSVDGTQRKEFRDNANVTKLSARDLGGHVQYSKVVTNATITNRCEEIKPLWGRLCRSLAPYSQKVKALLSKAWPSCLHGVSSVHMADDHFIKLRTGAMQGIGEHSSGTSPIVHLSLVQKTMTDPQFFALMNTVLMYRDQNASSDMTDFCMTELHHVKKTYVPRPGPMSVLLTRLHQIAWSWMFGTVFKDHRSIPIDLLHCNIQELRERLTESWHARVQGLVSQRQTFQGIQWTNVSLTVGSLAKLSAEDQAILRVCLNGTFFTADRQKHHKNNGSSTCKFCNQEDSQVHRHWKCPAFQQQRTVTESQATEIAAMQPCIAAHGWMPEPPSLQEFRKALMQLPDEHDAFVWPAVIPESLHAFTDGGCLAPTCKLGRLASWAVVLANHTFTEFQPLANGLVPGWIQTALRGEIWATISACEFAIQDTPEKVIRCFTEAVMTVEPQKAEGRLWILWAAFAKFYESHDDIENARVIFSKAIQVNYRGVDDLASVWCEWIEMELRHKEYDEALKVARQASGQKKAAALKEDKDTVQNRLYRSTKLWSLCIDLEESLGTTASTRAAYDATLEFKVATPALILSYARFLEDRGIL
eukprot:s1411_g9.t1